MVLETLEKLIEVLKRERYLLLKAVFEPELLEKLEETLNEKRKLLKSILELDAEELSPFSSKLREVERLNSRNEALAMSQLGFIERIAGSIMNDIKYNSSGSMGRSGASTFSKKI